MEFEPQARRRGAGELTQPTLVDLPVGNAYLAPWRVVED